MSPAKRNYTLSFRREDSELHERFGAALRESGASESDFLRTLVAEVLDARAKPPVDTSALLAELGAVRSEVSALRGEVSGSGGVQRELRDEVSKSRRALAVAVMLLLKQLQKPGGDLDEATAEQFVERHILRGEPVG
ncbi:MAG: hypothetical protein AAF682_28405 [Planctomycetota bacterium]